MVRRELVMMVVLAVLLGLLAGVVSAAPGVPWSYDLFDGQAISPTELSESFTLENTTVGHIFYHFAEGVTATNQITVSEGYDGELIVSQTVTAAITAETGASGAITLTMIYPDVTVTVSTETETGTATVGLWQR